jgi:hypothetical protein
MSIADMSGIPKSPEPDIEMHLVRRQNCEMLERGDERGELEIEERILTGECKVRNV